MLSLLFFRGLPKASHIKSSQLYFPHFRVRVFRISAFCAFCAGRLRNLLRPLSFWGERDLLHFLHFPRIGFESLISKIRPTGFTVIFDMITFLIQKHVKTVTVTVILRKLIQMTFRWESMEMKGRLRGPRR